MPRGRAKGRGGAKAAGEEAEAGENVPAAVGERPEEDMEVDPESATATHAIPQTFNREDFGEIEIPEAPQKVATYDINGPRLMITHIVNENFKSYAGVQTLGPFHKSFTSIVGPNGSGKSNVIDSMLFVFGYRANKIRSKKVSVLIHNSENHKDINSCTVAVHFQKIVDTGPGEDEYTVVPDSKIVVSRTAFKDNTSAYSVNGKRANYKEVATLLRASGIDLDHNRFLILQGEVEQIAMMKPKAQSEHEDGMLEFLEDIIGSNRFKQPIETLAQRVERLNEMRAEKLNRVKAVEKEKDELEGAKNEAVEYLTSENVIVRLKNKLYQKYIGECTESEEKAQAEFDKVYEGMKDVNEKKEAIAAQKKDKGKAHGKVHKEYEALAKQVEETKEKFSDLEKQDVKCREDIKHTNAKAKKLEKSLEQEKKRIEELRLVPEQSQKTVEEARKRLEKLEKEKAVEEEKVQEVMASLSTETKPLQEQKDKQEEKLLELQKSVNEKKSQLQVSESELEVFLSNQQSEEAKLKDMQQNLQKASTELEQHEITASQLRKQIPGVEKVVQKASQDLTQVMDAEVKASEKVRSLRYKVEEMRSAQQASSSKGRVLTFLLEQKKSGKIPGIFGRLGDLGAIDEKYDVAVSTACGALDHIVVDTMTTAQRCVELLIKNNIGVATFIGLDKMERWKEHAKKKIATPENVPRLFDLIKVKDERILTAFYFGVRDTLVANDLEQATRIAYGKTRFRVVTLQGQLIDQSGTMSGGGKTVSKGRMGSSVVGDGQVDPKELANLENELEKARKEAETCDTNRAKLQDLVATNTKDLTTMKHNLQMADMKVKALKEQVTSLQAQIKEQEVRVKAAAPDKKELDALRKKVEAFRKDYEKSAETSSKVEAEVQRLHKQIMDIGGSKLQAAQSRVDAIGRKIDEATGQITKVNVGVKTAERNLKKAEEKVRNLEEEMQENKEKGEGLMTLFKDLEEQATAVLEAHQQAQDRVGEVEKTLEGLRKEVGTLEEEEGALEKEQLEVRMQLEKFEIILKDNKAKLKHWRKELSNLKLSPVEGEEEVDLPTFTPEDLSAAITNDLKYEITVQEEKLAQMKPNMAAIAEYKKKEELYLARVSELDQITEVRDGQRRYHEDLRKQRLDEFMSGFALITGKLKEMYQMITLGGDAELELVDSLDPFSEGIVFSVRPPKKSWKNISNLSGGEKTLSSLALVFALHHYKPTPLYVMDEIDAALDFKNVSIVANYIKERTKNAQFIIISLRNNMFELADRLVGIYKTYNCTKSVTINPHRLQLPLQEINGAPQLPA
ncbi:structural maintenance of chromosomes protein 4-like [Babylonia areolata]|uniref:structural maintenance of chromosomes protein 4-like n=1 Tax=Babylonia areolata TaxID=304850 RepID=UPI003FCF7275